MYGDAGRRSAVRHGCGAGSRRASLGTRRPASAGFGWISTTPSHWVIGAGSVMSPQDSRFRRYRPFYTAREAAGRGPTVRRSAALRGCPGGLYGATIAELMARLGHSTPQAAMRYQHAAQGRDQVIAALLSKLAGDGP